jgi:asparagine N-glycosylation enzyme membrane subunit Stt3
LIKAYNALKASAIVAGVATYFALNPAAGVAAAAIAAGVLAAAQNLISRSNIDVGDFHMWLA